MVDISILFYVGSTIIHYNLTNNGRLSFFGSGTSLFAYMTVIKILLVDDQEELLDITRIFLEKGGDIVVETSTSAITAIEMLREHKYDAIVSDYEMPQMDGIEF